jgi:hypothetical protein
MRMRVKLKEPLAFLTVKRSQDYYRLRGYWLGELYYLRAKRRNGTGTKADIKVAQKELARLRKQERSK